MNGVRPGVPATRSRVALTADPVAVVVGEFARLLRRGIVEVLREDDAVRLLAENLDGAEIERAVLRGGARVALLSEEAVRSLSARVLIAGPGVGVVVIVRDPPPPYGMALLAAGISCLDWDASSVDVIAAVHRAALGGSIFVSRKHRVEHHATEKLTVRETAVLAYLCNGERYNAIAKELDIAPRTVKAHATSVCRKLKAHSKHELVGLPTFGSGAGFSAPRES